MHENVICENLTVEGIPILRLLPKQFDKNSLRTIFILHGWVSRKETYQFVGKILALYGYQVIVPDLPKHGEREQKKELVVDFWPIILESVEEFRHLLTYGKKVWHLKPEKTAVFGSSTGGFVSTGLFARYPEIKGLICVNGSGAWEETEILFRKMANRPPATEEEFAPIRENDPIRLLPKLPKRPMLLQHGTADSIIPIEGQRLFYEALTQAYQTEADLITTQEIPRMDHYISLGMFEDLFDWLEKHL